MKKLLTFLIIFLIVLVGALVAIPIFFKDDINQIVKNTINKQVNAKVDYNDYSLSLIKNFPNFTFTLEGLTVTGVDEFEGKDLAHISELGFTLDIMTVLKGETIAVKSIHIDRPTIDVEVRKNGKANYDIAKSTDETEKETTESQPFAVQLSQVKISDANITYVDRPGSLSTNIKGLTFEGSGDATNNLFDLNTETKIQSIDLTSGGVKYLNRANIKAAVDIAVDNINNKYTFKKNQININALGLNFDGFVQLKDKDAILTNLTFKSSEATFKSLLSLVPAIYLKDFESVKTAGSLQLAGAVNGTYVGESYPAFNLDVVVKDAMFQYPDLPEAVKNIAIDAHIKSKGGALDNMVIDIPRLHADMAGNPINVELNLKTPISNPDINTKINGKINLGDVAKFYPLEGVNKLQGMATADVAFKGTQRDIDAKRFNNIDAQGGIQLNNIEVESSDFPAPVSVKSANLEFTPQNVQLKKMYTTIGKSDALINAEFDNFLDYMIADETLKGRVNLESNYINADELLGSESATENSDNEESTSTTYTTIPENLNLALNSKIKKIDYDGLEITNLNGLLTMRQGILKLNNVKANMLDGNAMINGSYRVPENELPEVDFAYDLKNINITKAFTKLNTVEKIAPVAKYMDGLISSTLSLNTKVDADFNPQYNTMLGDGEIRINYAKLVGLPLMREIAKVTKLKDFENMQLNNESAVIKFKDGKVNVDPFTVKTGKYELDIQGSNGFDQSIDYVMAMDVPSSDLGAAAKGYVEDLLKKVPIPGLNQVIPETVRFNLLVSGSMTNPKVKLGPITAGGSNKGVGESVKDNLMDEFNKKKAQLQAEAEARKKELEAEARKKADEARKKAEAEANRLKQKAKEEADRKAQEARDKAKKAADDARKKAEEEAKKKGEEVKDKLKDAFKKPW